MSDERYYPRNQSFEPAARAFRPIARMVHIEPKGHRAMFKRSALLALVASAVVGLATLVATGADARPHGGGSGGGPRMGGHGGHGGHAPMMRHVQNHGHTNHLRQVHHRHPHHHGHHHHH